MHFKTIFIYSYSVFFPPLMYDLCLGVCLHTGANPLQTNGLGHTPRSYAKEGDASKVLQEFEGKV